jgi:K(+)-stimulated pyrophosphate-energized sodium pump
MLTDGLGLLGGTIIFIIYGRAAPDAARFGLAHLGSAVHARYGGIYKVADVGMTR